MKSYREALSALLEDVGGWRVLPFLTDGRAERLTHRLDGLASLGHRILPAPGDVFNAFRLTPLAEVKVVILGQDPYPTAGDAHGLAFSVARGGRLPRSLANVFRELGDDLGSPRAGGDLSDWAAQGVLMLNAVLTVEAGQAGSHRKLGWQALTDEAIATVSRRPDPTVFILWGADAQAKRRLIDAPHLVIESAHPSPLSARRGFFGSRPFSRANAFLRKRARVEIDWAGPIATSR